MRKKNTKFYTNFTPQRAAQEECLCNQSKMLKNGKPIEAITNQFQIINFIFIFLFFFFIFLLLFAVTTTTVVASVVVII